MIDSNTFRSICDLADKAGQEAVRNTSVVPMVVGQETSLFSGVIDETKPTYFVSEGPCGFSWVNVYPANKGNTRLGKEERRLLEQSGFHKNDYEKCYQLWISAYNQSMQKKEAYASAYAKVFRENGIKSYSGSRMD